MTVDFEPVDGITVCHCDMCRRWTGAFIEIPAKIGSVSHDGPVRAYASSAQVERAWCDRCGSTLWYLYKEGETRDYSFNAGLVDGAGGLILTREDFIDRKPAGYAFAGDHPRATEAQNDHALAGSVEGACS
ncbi:MAG: GFA family protein [Pseudomonadota bacterium]